MKSSREDLRKRGKFEMEDLIKMDNQSNDELLDLIYSVSSGTRSAAVHLLSKRGYIDNIEFVTLLLEILLNETCLYTKIEICDALEKGNSVTAAKMTEYLGRIGNNQYHTLPDKVSKKISYPCPRDVVARTFGHMSPAILPALVAVLYSEDTVKISEVLDGFGFLVFYNQSAATMQLLEHIIKTMDTYSENNIIYWKCVICLSAFPLQESIDLLNDIIASSKIEIIRYEAERSLKLIQKRGQK